MSDLNVRVQRDRPVCPYCKAAVEGGDVWLCPACFAQHHAECHHEHVACATCGHGRPAAAAAATASPPAEHAGLLAAVDDPTSNAVTTIGLLLISGVFALVLGAMLLAVVTLARGG